MPTRRLSWSTLLTGCTVTALVALSGCTALANGSAERSTAPTTAPTSAASAQPPAASTSPAPTKRATAQPSKAAPPAKPTPTKKPAPAALLKRGDDGDRVRELQHRLRQLEWFSGNITGSYGKATETGVSGFQDKRGYDASGEVDQKTWDKLASMTKKPSRDDMYNILRPGPAILERGDNGEVIEKRPMTKEERQKPLFV